MGCCGCRIVLPQERLEIDMALVVRDSALFSERGIHSICPRQLVSLSSAVAVLV